MELTRNIRWRRLQRVGYVIRIVDERVPEKSLNGYIEGRRPVGRPGGRCLDAVDRDIKWMLKCRNWQRIEMPGGGGLRRPGGGGLRRPGGGRFRCLEGKN
jgi:hypothetical protein